jgi:hypothetical protein
LVTLDLVGPVFSVSGPVTVLELLGRLEGIPLDVFEVEVVVVTVAKFEV